jgi:hypothetical protein
LNAEILDANLRWRRMRAEAARKRQEEHGAKRGQVNAPGTGAGMAVGEDGTFGTVPRQKVSGGGSCSPHRSREKKSATATCSSAACSSATAARMSLGTRKRQ